MTASSDPNGPPQHSVGIVGGRGAGKTVYLAALYNALEQQRENTGFYLEAPRAQSQRLVSMFATLAGHDWLPATGYRNISEWNFTIGVMARERGWPACRFDYYDYAGELIDTYSDETDEQAADIANKLSQCQAIIVFLDGERICNFITGENPEDRNKFAIHDLRNIINAVNPSVRGSKLRSLQFVITKWDYVQKTGRGLEEIKALLLSLGYFRDFTETLAVRRGKFDTTPAKDDELQAFPLIRLIPVSSVGFSFVERRDPELGMVIDDHAQPSPWNVVAPLACVLIDIIRAELLAAQRKRTKLDLEKYSSHQSKLDWLKNYALKAVLTYVPKKWTVNIHVLQMLRDILEEHAYSIQETEEARYRDFFEKKEKSLKAVIDNETAFAHAVNICQMMQQDLNREFPANELV